MEEIKNRHDLESLYVNGTQLMFSIQLFPFFNFFYPSYFAEME